MGRLFVVNLEGRIYGCKHCGTHLALSDNIESKAFQCKHGKAYLFRQVPPRSNGNNLSVFTGVNVNSGKTEDRMMTTGLHTVADIFCVGCGSNVGWKYETAHEKGQKYKEGKFVLERYKISGPDQSNYWISQEAHPGGSDADDA